MFEPTSIVFTAAGLAVFAAALLRRLLMGAPISMPMVFLGAGVLIFTFAQDLPDPDPVKYHVVTTHLTEVYVIVSLVGVGRSSSSCRSWCTASPRGR